jgi:hypothetical protein
MDHANSLQRNGNVISVIDLVDFWAMTNLNETAEVRTLLLIEDERIPSVKFHS